MIKIREDLEQNTLYFNEYPILEKSFVVVCIDPDNNIGELFTKGLGKLSTVDK